MEVTVIVHVLALLAAQSMAQTSNACQPVDSTLIHAHVHAILVLKSPQRRAEQTSDLARDWKARCMDSRRFSSRETVRDVARLLINRESRLMASFMLMDISDNLKAAKPAVTSAVAAQVRSDRRLYQGAYSAIPQSSLYIFSALRCIQTKIDSGRLEKEVCADLLRYDRELDELRGRPWK
jgi:hypothetical protein